MWRPESLFPGSRKWILSRNSFQYHMKVPSPVQPNSRLTRWRSESQGLERTEGKKLKIGRRKVECSHWPRALRCTGIKSQRGHRWALFMVKGRSRGSEIQGTKVLALYSIPSNLGNIIYFLISLNKMLLELMLHLVSSFLFSYWYFNSRLDARKC